MVKVKGAFRNETLTPCFMPVISQKWSRVFSPNQLNITKLHIFMCNQLPFFSYPTQTRTQHTPECRLLPTQTARRNSKRECRHQTNKLIEKGLKSKFSEPKFSKPSRDKQQSQTPRLLHQAGVALTRPLRAFQPG